jgi:hypothetical protein
VDLGPDPAFEFDADPALKMMQIHADPDPQQRISYWKLLIKKPTRNMTRKKHVQYRENKGAAT